MQDEVKLIPSKNVPNFFFSIRFLSAFLVFFGVAAQYMQKIDMSISIVCMVKDVPDVQNNTVPSYSEVFLSENLVYGDKENITCMFQPKNGTETHDGEFNWSKSVQGLILSSYFYGYMIAQIPSGWLSYKIGGRKVLGYSMFMGSLLTMLVPVSSRLSYVALIFLRFITGIIHGAVWPALSSMFVFWAPPLEKSRLIGISGAGSWIGNVIALPLGGYLCKHGFDGGWSSIFYVFGIMGIVWFLSFMFLTADSPDKHRFISNDEKLYLNENTQTNASNSVERPTPWAKIFTSKPCWAIFITHFTCNWCNYLFLTQLPSFMNDILKFDIKSNGLFSTLPYIACWLVSILSALISDILIEKRVLSVKNVRKLMNGIGLGLAIIATFFLIYVSCAQPYLAVALLTVALGFYGMCSGAGYTVNINEVGGVYSGILFGISNCIGTIPGLIAPYIVGVITSKKLQSEWTIVFIISICVYAVGLIFSSLWTGDKQFYDDQQDNEISTENNSIQTHREEE